MKIDKERIANIVQETMGYYEEFEYIGLEQLLTGIAISIQIEYFKDSKIADGLDVFTILATGKEEAQEVMREWHKRVEEELKPVARQLQEEAALKLAPIVYNSVIKLLEELKEEQNV